MTTLRTILVAALALFALSFSSAFRPASASPYPWLDGADGANGQNGDPPTDGEDGEDGDAEMGPEGPRAGDGGDGGRGGDSFGFFPGGNGGNGGDGADLVVNSVSLLSSMYAGRGGDGGDGGAGATAGIGGDGGNGGAVLLKSVIFPGHVWVNGGSGGYGGEGLVHAGSGGDGGSAVVVESNGTAYGGTGGWTQFNGEGENGHAGRGGAGIVLNAEFESFAYGGSGGVGYGGDGGDGGDAFALGKRMVTAGGGRGGDANTIYSPGSRPSSAGDGGTATIQTQSGVGFFEANAGQGGDSYHGSGGNGGAALAYIVEGWSGTGTVNGGNGGFGGQATPNAELGYRGGNGGDATIRFLNSPLSDAKLSALAGDGWTSVNGIGARGGDATVVRTGAIAKSAFNNYEQLAEGGDAGWGELGFGRGGDAESALVLESSVGGNVRLDALGGANGGDARSTLDIRGTDMVSGFARAIGGAASDADATLRVGSARATASAQTSSTSLVSAGAQAGTLEFRGPWSKWELNKDNVAIATAEGIGAATAQSVSYLPSTSQLVDQSRFYSEARAVGRTTRARAYLMDGYEPTEANGTAIASATSIGDDTVRSIAVDLTSEGGSVNLVAGTSMESVWEMPDDQFSLDGGYLKAHFGFAASAKATLPDLIFLSG